MLYFYKTFNLDFNYLFQIIFSFLISIELLKNDISFAFE